MMKNKSIGAVFVIISIVLGIVSLIRFCPWANAHQAMDMTVVAAIIGGIILSLVLLVWDEDILMIISCALYAYGVIRHLANQVGSFVDAFQGVNLFGDATQVGTILTIAEIMGAALLAAVIASFLKREK